MSKLLHEDEPKYLEIEILTPTHVGVAKENYWVNHLDFTYIKGKVYKYDLLAYLKDACLNDMELQNISLKIMNGESTGISLDKLKKWTTEYPFNGNDKVVKNGIRPQIRTGMGLPILPGSSLKGAVRSVIYNHLLSQHEIYCKLPDELKRNVFPKDLKNKEHQKQLDSWYKNFSGNDEQLFGKIDSNLMRLIRISDAEFLPDATELWITKIRSLLKNEGNKFKEGWKDRYDPVLRKNTTIEQFNLNVFATVYETLSKGTKAYFKIKIAKELYKLIEGKPINKEETYSVRNGHFVKNKSLSDIFALINDYTLKYLTAEIAFIEATTGQKSEEILESLNDLKAKTVQAKKRKRCLHPAFSRRERFSLHHR